jgi:hypothetical protein
MLYRDEAERMVAVREYNKGVRHTTDRLESRIQELKLRIQDIEGGYFLIPVQFGLKLRRIRESAKFINVLDHEIYNMYQIFKDDERSDDIDQFIDWATKSPIETYRNEKC